MSRTPQSPLSGLALLCLLAVWIVPKTSEAQLQFWPQHQPHQYWVLLDPGDWFPTPISGKFYGVSALEKDGYMYFAVGSGARAGVESGPGSECAWEDSMLFRVPATDAGMRGAGLPGGKPEYLGVATPCTGEYLGFNMPGSLFQYKPEHRVEGATRYFLTSHHTFAWTDGEDPGDGKPCGDCFHRVLIGRTDDLQDVARWRWQTLLETGGAFRMLSPYLVPHPSRENTVTGVTYILPPERTTPQDPSWFRPYTTCIEISDFATRIVGEIGGSMRLGCDPSTAREYELSRDQPPLVELPPSVEGSLVGFRPHGLATIDGGLWISGAIVRSAPVSAPSPCLAGESEETFAANMSDGTQTNTVREAAFSRVHLAPSGNELTILDQPQPLVSLLEVRPSPPAYLAQQLHPAIFETPTGYNYLYFASRDEYICRHRAQADYGASIVVTHVQEDF